MTVELPDPAKELDRFLLSSGFTKVRDEEFATFNNKIIEYVNGDVVAKIERDRSVWIVQFADKLSEGKWFDAGVLSEFFSGPKDALDLEEQVRFVEGNLPEILTMLGPERAVQTHQELARLKTARVQRRYPGFPKATG